MELGVRIGGGRSGEITTTESQQVSSIHHLKTNVKKATKEPDDSDPISVDSIKEILTTFFPGLRKPVAGNLAIITVAFMTVLEVIRSGNGKITLASIARALPLAGKFKILYQRLSQFLHNKFLDPGALTEGLFKMVLGLGVSGLVPVIVDQTQVAGVLVILAGIAFSGRVFPLGLHAYTNEDIRSKPDRDKSRNWHEVLFLLRILEACPVDLTLLFVLDRGYARVILIRKLLAQPGVMFLMRAPKNVVVRYRKREQEVATALGKIKVKNGQMIRLSRVLYRKTKPVQVDIVIYWEPVPIFFPSSLQSMNRNDDLWKVALFWSAFFLKGCRFNPSVWPRLEGPAGPRMGAGKN